MGPLYLDPKVISFNSFYFLYEKILAHKNIEAPMYGPSSDVSLESIHQRMIHSSEDGQAIHWFIHTSECPYIGGIVHTSEDGPYIGASMFEHAFRMKTSPSERRGEQTSKNSTNKLSVVSINQLFCVS